MPADLRKELAPRPRYEDHQIGKQRKTSNSSRFQTLPQSKSCGNFEYCHSCLATLTTTQTYSAQVTSVLPTLLSAIRVSPPSEGPAHDGKVIGKDIVTYKYNQPVAIPSYLIAIAAGDLRYRAFTKPSEKNWSSGVWTEPSLMKAAFWEFSEDTTRRVACTM